MKSSKMKKWKKQILALLMCVILAFNGGISAFADETQGSSVGETQEASPTESGTTETGNEETNPVCETCSADPCVCEEAEAALCEVCNADPCVCEEAEAALCEVCNADPCVCEEAEAALCEVCNADPCVCEKAEAALCEVCNADPCVCEKAETTLCEVCNADPCTCEEEKEETFVDSVSYEDDDVEIVVTALEEGAIPEGVTLKVTKIVKLEVTEEMSEEEQTAAEEMNAQYDATEQKLEEEVQKTEDLKMTGFFAYDITFVDEEGNKVEPGAKVLVSINYKKAAAPEALDSEKETGVTMMHLEEDAEGTVVNVVDMAEKDQLTNLETTDAKEVSKAEFETESFSVFALLWTEMGAQTMAVASAPTPNKLAVIGDTEGINISLFDYSIALNNTVKQRVGKKWGNGFFLISGGRNIDEESDENNDYHAGLRFSHSRIQFARQDMVCYNLKDGYPVLNDNYDKTLVKQVKPTVEREEIAGGSLNYLFNEEQLDGKTAYTGLSGLLQQDNEGYYFYDSHDNHAQLNQEKKTIDVYDQKVTHLNDNEYKIYNGQFLPFDDISKTEYASDPGIYRLIDDTNTDKDENRGNLWFGMKIEADFYQPEGGKVKQKDMVFKFGGDDDVWVYVDGIKLLDIGGIHGSIDGSINFQTGEIVVKGKMPSDWNDDFEPPTDYKKGDSYVLKTTIRECFEKAYKEKKPSATQNEINAYLAQYFEKGSYTFKDYSSHSLKFFYLERGAGHSNCNLKFNLPILETAPFTVKKQIEGYKEGAASDIDFQFQLSVESENKLSDAANVTYTLTKADGTTETKTTDGNGKFTLKHNETAKFENYQKGTKYQVTEIGVNSEAYEKVTVKVDGRSPASTSISGTGQSAASSILEVGKDKEVLFVNSCSDLPKLVIDKKLAGYDANVNADNDAEYTMLVTVAGEAYKGKYKVGSTQLAALTSEEKITVNGEITLKKNQVVVLLGYVTKGNDSGFPVGTAFKVEETGLDTEKYQEPTYEIASGTANNSTTANGYSGFASGNFLARKDAVVTVRNKMWHSIEVKKEWDTTAAGPMPSVYVGLYTENTDAADSPISYISLDAVNAKEVTGTFTKLAETTGYKVKELRQVKTGETAEFTIESQGYIGVENSEIITINNNSYRVTYGNLTQAADAPKQTITITNTQLGTLKIIKVSSSDSNLRLAGAKFKIEKLNTTTSQYEVFINETEATGTNGELIFTNLEAGTYRITETQAPEGYSIVATINDQTMGKNGAYEVTVTVENVPLFALPSTGGNGTYWYTISGMLLLIGAVLTLYKNKRKEVLR